MAIPGYIPFNHASDMVINIAMLKNIHSSTGERCTQLGNVGMAVEKNMSRCNGRVLPSARLLPEMFRMYC